MSPDPRLSPLPLTEFNLDVVQDTLHDLARQMTRNFGPLEFKQNASLVYGLSEGLPALLVRCLQWIRAQEWLEMWRLESQQLFEELAYPYIREELLSPASLLPSTSVQSGMRGGPASGQQRALMQAFRILTPYRLFTQSHLRHYLGPDRAFRESIEAMGWSMEDLWQAISGTALLLRQCHSA